MMERRGENVKVHCRCVPPSVLSLAVWPITPAVTRKNADMFEAHICQPKEG